MKNNTMKLTFNDALLVYLFGRKDRKETVESLAQVCTAFPDEEMRTTAFVLKEQIAQISDFVWPELYRQTAWNIDNTIRLERFIWDQEDEPDDEEDFDDEDDAYDRNE